MFNQLSLIDSLLLEEIIRGNKILLFEVLKICKFFFSPLKCDLAAFGVLDESEGYNYFFQLAWLISD